MAETNAGNIHELRIYKMKNYVIELNLTLED